MAEVSDEVLNLMASHPWDESIPRLTRYAFGKMRKLFWQGILGGPAPSGIEAKDIVLISIEKIMNGDRTWDPRSQENLYKHLTSVIDSEISHLINSWENRHFFREAVLSGRPNSDGKTAEFWDNVSCPNSGPEDILIDRERERLSENFFWKFYEFIADTPLLQAILERITEGDKKRADIAASMGIKVKEFDNLKKQLQRRLKSFQEIKNGEAHNDKA
ncbi:MAG: hypothetical protein D9V46_03715 [Deltaproteobacteria bacterium]|uniref:hypothetical protein n=1 Tax=Hydrosulfovibrio ferrireducens TaxID=2934181 RepID=UPI0012240A98|nr:MAG: hypothetical protein D9V46_03715 [Deltaproteobacteria bacterium]